MKVTDLLHNVPAPLFPTATACGHQMHPCCPSLKQSIFRQDIRMLSIISVHPPKLPLVHHALLVTDTVLETLALARRRGVAALGGTWGTSLAANEPRGDSL